MSASPSHDDDEDMNAPESLPNSSPRAPFVSPLTAKTRESETKTVINIHVPPDPIEVKKDDSSRIPSIHLMPCAINHSGPARVSTYFHPLVVDNPLRATAFNPSSSLSDSESKETFVQASFRGREVTGKVIHLSKDMTGLVVKQSNAQSVTGMQKKKSRQQEDLGDEHELDWTVSQKFSSFVVWCPDKLLYERESIPKTIEEWAVISHGIHDPL